MRVTRATSASSSPTGEATAADIRKFGDFAEERNPYGEHDFGVFGLDGAGRIFWTLIPS